jgi:hypothetical protein
LFSFSFQKKSNPKNTRTPTRTPKSTPDPGLEVLNPQCSQDKDYLCPNGKCVDQMQDCEYGNGKGNPDREGGGNFEEDIFGPLEVDEFEETIR